MLARHTVLHVGANSGLIIAFVVVVWAAYFIPLALRRYDEASKDSSVEGVGSLSRVITKPRADQAVETDQPVAESTAPPAQAPRSIDRPAARLAAKRRRRTLLALLAIAAVVIALAVSGVVAMPFIAAPLALIVAWLVACRVQVRGERGLSGDKSPRLGALTNQVSNLTAKSKTAKPAKATKGKSKGAEPFVGATAADEEQTVIVSGQFEDIDPGRPHVMEVVDLEADALDDKIVIAVPSVSSTGDALWDPLPVTLPTYVTKPRAGRTVRTIDFSQPNTWTSGHIEGQDVELPARADDTGEHRRAVGH